MSAGNFVSYNGHTLKMLDGTLDMDGDSIAVALLTSSYTPSATHAAFSDLTNELSHASYSAGSNAGILLANKAVTQISGKQYKFASDAVQITFASTDATFKYAVFFERNATAASAALLGYIDLNTTGSITVLADNQLSINCPTNGWFNVTGAS